MKDSTAIVQRASEFLKEVEVENEDLIEQFLYEADKNKDPDMLEAVKLILTKCTDGENPFTKYTYYDLIQAYEEIQNSK